LSCANVDPQARLIEKLAKVASQRVLRVFFMLD